MSEHPWIFGYGSLIWRPAFPYLQRRPGYITGYVRRFWQASTDHRGTPESPGRVVTLLAEPGAVCWGMAYQVHADEASAVLDALDFREQAGYERVLTEVMLDTPGQGQGDEARIQALLYVASDRNPNYLGPLTLEEIAAVVRTSHGPSGSNREYVLRLAAALAEMGAHDPHVAELARMVEQ